MGNGWDVDIGEAQDVRPITDMSVDIGDAQDVRAPAELDTGLWKLIQSLFGADSAYPRQVFLNGEDLGQYYPDDEGYIEPDQYNETELRR